MRPSRSGSPESAAPTPSHPKPPAGHRTGPTDGDTASSEDKDDRAMREATQQLRRRKPKRELGPSEPIWYLRGLPYSNYRQSRHWRRRSKAFREEIACDTCGLCGLSPRSEEALGADWIQFAVHHVSYKRLGYERDTDLILLCPPCHNLVHYPDSAGARHWREYNAHLPDLAERARELVPPELA
jgi:hypothetical protein